MNSEWSVSGTGYSVKDEEGKIIFECRQVNPSPDIITMWLEFADDVCKLHNEKSPA